MSARKKKIRKFKTSKKAKLVSEELPAPKSHQKPKNIKGSVTVYLENKNGKIYTESELINGLDEDLRDAWQKLRAFAESLGNQRIYASVQTIMFSRKICYFYVRPKKKFLEIWIFLPRKIEGLVAMQGPSKKEKYGNLFKVVHADQVEEPLTDWIREAFDFAPNLD